MVPKRQAVRPPVADLRPDAPRAAHVPDARGASAPLVEVFASVQGEGRFVGEPQIFVRLAGCPLRCRYCDTEHSWSPAGARVEASTVVERVLELDGARPRTVSITGGEPLVWPDFVRELARDLRESNGVRRVHLESSGAPLEALFEVIDQLDHLSLDLKAPEDLAALPRWDQGDTPIELPADDAGWTEHRRALLPKLEGRDAVLKLVLTARGSFDGYARMIDDVARLAPNVPVVLQPATAVRGERSAEWATVSRLADRGLALGLELRVLPQIHPILGVR